MIDIIIPAYNSHEYLVKCLSSIAIQNCKDLVHVYIIDDCSKKDFQSVVDIFKDDLKITLYRNKTNLGPGQSRQKGIDISKGKYIMFLDSDDILYNPFSLSYLYDKINGEDLDVVYGKYYEVYKDNTFAYEYNDCNLHAKLYRREYLLDNDIKFFDERYHEDNMFNNEVVLGNSKLGFVSEFIMVYKRRDDSLSSINNYSYNTIDVYIRSTIKLIRNCEKKKYKKENIAFITTLCMTYLYVNYYYNISDKNVNDIITLSKPIFNKFKKYRSLVTNNQIYGYILKYDLRGHLKNSFDEFLELYNN